MKNYGEKHFHHLNQEIIIIKMGDKYSLLRNSNNEIWAPKYCQTPNSTLIL